MYAPVVAGQWKTAHISPGEALVTNTTYVCVWVLSGSIMPDSLWTQAPLSMGFLRQG